MQQSNQKSRNHQTQDTSTILSTSKTINHRTNNSKQTELNTEDQSTNMDQESKDTAIGVKNGNTQLNGVIQDAEELYQSIPKTLNVDQDTRQIHQKTSTKDYRCPQLHHQAISKYKNPPLTVHYHLKGKLLIPPSRLIMMLNSPKLLSFPKRMRLLIYKISMDSL